ncbi:hypothetical protein BTR22_10360 [Alkalihalophilus pseudofirmus]|uniref:hypothetical protein n=1 Tax=Alkalihalophilus pseudofirmus TaxID=79885 RepID=UPI000950D224|nr:hypothetical protein BTR22_10360 [Alkalihalophilus pseudofirmus]
MYTLKDHKRFEITNYQQKSPFASFLPGIAGVDGIPMWVFYVNRGQGIASFGVQDKNHAMLEFMPADKSYQQVQIQGFRTFIKVKEDGKETFIEAFSPLTSGEDDVQETMKIEENMLALEYLHQQHAFKLNVEYFILPEAPFAGLVRTVTLTNLGDAAREFEIVDGLPSIFPSGVPHAAYKELGHTIKSWFDVKNIENKIPFYQLRGSIEDSAEVKQIHHGHFYTSFSRTPATEEKHLEPIIDKDAIFGSDTSLQVPRAFLNEPVHSLKDKPQHTTNKVSCGFSCESASLQTNEQIELYTVIGYAKNLDLVNKGVKETLSISALCDMKTRAQTITDSITNKMATKTSQPLFDAYVKQSYLDNGLRGGFPLVVERDNEHKMYYLFSRKHGDLERDYNFFSISPTYYSQGNGNFRDINQNRRCDVLLEPRVKDYNVQQFMNLIQLDGYNPLVVKGVRFKVNSTLNLASYVEAGEEKLQSFLEKSYTPGELKHFVEDENISLSEPFESLLAYVMHASEELQQAEFGEGYWVDHWTYNLDLIDSYLAIYPDKADEFFLTPGYRFFDSPVRVKTRREKYRLAESGLRQYEAVEKIAEKASQAAQNEGVLWVKDESGEIYHTSLYSKLVTLALVKTSTMAPFGLGIEMEGDKPGWNDSLNGLPGMIGASTSELYELKRLLALLDSVESGGEIALPVEVNDFLLQVAGKMKEVEEGSDEAEQRYWKQVTSHREAYRENVYAGISGQEVTYTVEEIKEYVKQLAKRVDTGIERVESYAKPFSPTYFYFEPKEDLTQESLERLEFDWSPKAVTPYLEGVVKQLKLTDDRDSAKALYDEVKQSAIYDRKLKMYKTSMSINSEPNELGRVKSFTPGWLENESIFLHMEYKYLLATLKSGLYDEFYEDMKQALIPFLDPEMYGRSILENSSFIASSANPNVDLHGKGFVSRLSGSTIELMNMWFVMMTGGSPFKLKEGELSLELSPRLPDWMFDENGEVTFTFLGEISVTYITRAKKSTYGDDAVTPSGIELTFKDGAVKEVLANEVTGELAQAVRSRDVSKMNVYLS